MSYDVSSWFYSQLQLRNSSPKRVFLIGDEDYSERVVKWPTIKRSATQIIASKATISLANADGEMNFFHERLWTMPDTCTIQIGFTHPDSGDELINIFSGDIKEVKYAQKQCKLHIRDRLWALTEKKVGDSDAPVTFSYELPSDVAWTLCTSWGELDDVASSSNVHIDYESFNLWAEQFSTDSVLMSFNYDGVKVADALTRLGKMTDSAIWTEGDGKLYFKRYTEPSSLDFLIDQDAQVDIEIKIDGLYLVNKAWVYGNYSPESSYWQTNVFDISTIGVNTYGLHEQIWKDETCWYVTSAGCQNMAQRKVSILKFPPKKFLLSTGLIGIHRQIGETIRFVDSFYSVNSGTGWRFNEVSIDLNNGLGTYTIDESIAGNAFFLDIDSLDVDDRLLL